VLCLLGLASKGWVLEDAGLPTIKAKCISFLIASFLSKYYLIYFSTATQRVNKNDKTNDLSTDVYKELPKLYLDINFIE
jgi:hypothetical protein